MAITYSDSIISARQRLFAFTTSAAFAALPDRTKTFLTNALGEPSPVDGTVKALEALYAARDSLDADGQQVCADMAYQVLQGQFHGKGERAGQIVAAMQRDVGDVPADPDAVDPEPDGAFAPTEPEPEPE
jgi:hypothetical protein